MIECYAVINIEQTFQFSFMIPSRFIRFDSLCCSRQSPGACPGFLKGGVQWSDGGGVQYISLPIGRQILNI